VTGPGDAGDAVAADPSRTAATTAPWADSRFWLLQLVVLALALIRLAVTVGFGLDSADLVLEVSTFTVFVIPVVVGSLNYGLRGGIATVAWITVLDIPHIAEVAGNHRTGAVWVEVLQVIVLVVLAVLIGQRVSAETRLRERADAASRARLRAEQLYQDMFESNRSPILIVDADGYVVESNRSADLAFGPRTGTSGGPATGGALPRLVDVVGADAAALVLTRLVSDDGGAVGPVVDPGGEMDGADVAGAAERVRPVAFEIDGQPVLLRPTATLVGTTGGDRRMQVIFDDVTMETRRHDLMEAYAGQVVLGQEEERRHIAQELHDGPLQALIHLCRQIDSLVPDPGPVAVPDIGAAPGPGPAPGSQLAAMRTTVEETVAELRSIARGLRPSVLDDLGLVASINQVVTEATGRQGFDGSFEVLGPVRRLPPPVELALFRIAQEAVTNAERHAAAGQVTVTLGFAETGIRLTVSDDGTGFEPSLVRPVGQGQSLGLPGMGERARLIGGRLKVRSEPGHGTTVEAWVPALATRV
jgi:signal transduction histidine kinase